jgi:acyl-ACP thioesterase
MFSHLNSIMSVGLHSDMIPIDIMVKYSPPMIALHYKMQNQSEDYLHQIPINVKPTASAQAIYEELLVEHFAYIGPKTMRKPQVTCSTGS